MPVRTSEDSRGITHVPALDGLRGLAVVAVLVYHGGHLQGGFLGVDLFFVLSGYLITALLLAEWRGSGRIRLGAFYARRARRLLPALVLLLAGVAIYAAVWAEPSELAQIRGDAFATLAYVANWHSIFANHGYWSMFSAPSPLEHTWSLAIEEQFYLVWPLVAIGVLRWARGSAGWLCATAATIACASGAWLIVSVAWGADVSRAYLGTDTRTAAILLGATLAAAQVRFGHVGHRFRAVLEIAALAGSAFLAWSYFRVTGLDSWLYRGGLFACGIAATVMIAAATHPERGLLARGFAWRPLRALGLVSYGLYLWHWPVYLVLTEPRTGLTDPALLAVRLGVTLAVATVSYLVVELPIRRGALPRRPTFVLAPASALLAAIAIVATTSGAAIPSVAAFPTLPTPSRSAFISTSGRGARPVPVTYGPLTNPCVLMTPLRVIPRTAARARAPRVMVVGDSVSCFAGAGVEHLAPQLGITAYNRGVTNCAFVMADGIRYLDGRESVQGAPCGDTWDADLRAFRPQLVIVILGAPGSYDWRVHGSWLHPCDPAFDSWYAAGVRDSLVRLTASGAQVAMVTISHPPKVFASSPNVEVPRRLIEGATCINLALAGVVAQVPGAHLVDLDAYICPGGKCQDRIDGVELRHDGVHFVGAAADIVARWLIPRALAAAHLVSVPPAPGSAVR